MIYSNDASKKIVHLHVNGKTHEAVIRSADMLLHTLLQQLGLTAAIPACQNGACTVIVDGQPMHACLSLSIETVDQSITTNEGLSNSPLQQAFVDKWAIQCGYCTSGFIANCHALVEQHPDADDATIDEWLSSNLCRCTGYQEIKEAVKSVLQSKGNLS